MAFGIEQDIIRFDVPMNNALLVYIPQGTAQLCHPKSYCLLGKGFSRNMKPQVAAIH